MLNMQTIGMRQLRLELPRLIERVRNGETIEITERGVPVARLVPLPGRQTILDRMIADGRVRPAIRPFHTIPPPLKAPFSLSAEIIRMREEEDR